MNLEEGGGKKWQRRRERGGGREGLEGLSVRILINFNLRTFSLPPFRQLSLTGSMK